MLNRVIIQGRIVRDPELKQTNNGVHVCAFTVACDRDTKDENGQRAADFIDCVAWRGTADLVTKYFQKGSQIIVEGRLQSRKWHDKNGQNRIAWDVQVSSVNFCGSKSDNASGAQYGNRPAQNQNQGMNQNRQGGGYEYSYGGNSGGVSVEAEWQDMEKDLPF